MVGSLRGLGIAGEKLKDIKSTERPKGKKQKKTPPPLWNPTCTQWETGGVLE